jgi:hypothetical protein
MSREQASPFGVICVQDGNRVIRRAVLEHDYQTTIAKPPWTALVRDFTVMKQIGPIRFGEMLALIREHIVGLVQFVCRHKGYSGLGRNLPSRTLRGGYQDQVHLSHSREKRTKGRRCVIPRFANLCPGSAEIVHKNDRIILA